MPCGGCRLHPPAREAICSVAEKLGPKSETVRQWIIRAETNAGRRPGVTSDELAEMKRLKRENNAEMKRANDILKAAAHFFGAELDRDQPNDPVH